MNLELGIVKEAGEAMCSVRLVGSSTDQTLPYSAPMKEHGVKVHPGWLAAVDVDAHEVVYRVARLGEVEGVSGETYSVSIRDASGKRMAGFEGTHDATRIEGLAKEFAVGDRVYFTAGENGKIFDEAADGQPSMPERIESAVFPRIEEAYSRA